MHDHPDAHDHRHDTPDCEPRKPRDGRTPPGKHDEQGHPAPAPAIAVLSSLALAACGGGGGPLSPDPSSPPPPAPAGPSPTPFDAPPAELPLLPGTPTPPTDPVDPVDPVLPGTAFHFPQATTDAEAARFLQQSQFTSLPADIAAVRSQPYADWIAQQMLTPPAQSAWDWLEARGYGQPDAATRYFDQSYPADYACWRQLMTAPDQMRQRVALALSEYFVVSLNGLDIEWRSHAAASWWDMLAANAFGNFRTLLRHVTLHPAMGHYLNTRGNQKEDASGRQPDENYAREVMQLFTIGVSQLQPDGTPVRSGGVPVDSYNADDVTQLARVFTGWDFDKSVSTTFTYGTRTVGGKEYTRKPMRFIAASHSTLAASFLGTTVAASTDGEAALDLALDTLFRHPNTAPFFARQMIQRLVTSDPSPAYVQRVAQVFDDDGAGRRGNLAAVFRAIWLDDAARDPAVAALPVFGKLREPIVRAVQWARTAGVASARGSWKIGDLSRVDTHLGQSPLRSPSVFNFFRPGYVPPGTALAASGATAPEFQLVSESSVAGWVNYLQNMAQNGFYVAGPDMPQSVSNASNGYDIAPTYVREFALVTDVPALVAHLNLVLAAGQLKPATVAAIASALAAATVTATSSIPVKRNRIAAATLLVMASADYLVQK